MRRFLILLFTFLILLLAPLGVRYFWYYGLDGAEAEAPPEFEPENVPAVPTPASVAFREEPEVGEGWILLDRAHDNDFELEELSYLDGRLAARGYDLLEYEGEDLDGVLRSVNAFVVVAPLAPFSREEIQAVANFVDRGGRLLLVGDPTRFNVDVEETASSFDVNILNDDLPLNSLANQFGVIFRGDYLYNTRESEGNYRNIILREGNFASAALTEQLETIVFYGSHSLQVNAQGRALISAGDDTWSSLTRRAGPLTVAALSSDDRVLALGDLNFLGEPYNDVYDNARFISRIADFLVEPGRGFVLGDFPFFYRSPVDLVYAGTPQLGPDIFDEVIDLQEAFGNVDRQLSLRAEPAPGHDVLYLGLYNQAEELEPMLTEAGVTLLIEPPLPSTETTETDTEADEARGRAAGATAAAEEPSALRQIQSNLGKVQMAGTALMVLREEGEQRQLIVLAASTDGLEQTVNRLLDVVPVKADYALSDCLLQEMMALCPTNVADEEVEEGLRTTGTVPDADEEEEDDAGDEETSGEEDGDVGGGTGGEYIEAIDAYLQGFVGLGDERQETLDRDQAHAWAFSEGPATIDILLESDEEMDGTLSVFDGDYNLVEGVDDGLTGQNEQLGGIEVPADETYTIVVRDFFGEGGSYTLSVGAGEEREEDEAAGPPSVFLFGDDRGSPSGTPFTSVSALAEMLPDAFEVTIWIASEDGALEADTLAGYDLVIWSSGNYRNEEIAFDEDALIIFDYFVNGGSLFVTGATTTFLEGEETTFAPIADLEVAGEHDTLLEGLESGEIVELDQTYEATVINADETGEEGATILFVRGPNSEQGGSAAGVAFADEFSNSHLYLLAAPFTALPESIQEIVLNNLLVWLDLA